MWYFQYWENNSYFSTILIASTVKLVMFDVDARNISLDPKSFCFSNLGSLWKLLGTCTIIVLLVLVGRAAFVFPLSAISNYFIKREDRSSSPSMISFKQQVGISSWVPLFLSMVLWELHWPKIVQIIIWWAGLMRGAVSIALAFKQVNLFSLIRAIHRWK